MKLSFINLSILLTLLISSSVNAESMGYYKKFFDRITEITHDPEYPEFENVNAKNDIYQIKKIDSTTGVGLAVNLSLKESGRYAFWLLRIDHRWKNGARKIKFGKCQAFNGNWEYKDGKLFLGTDLILEAAYVGGINMMQATFTGAKRPQGTEGIDIFLNDGSIDTLMGFSPNADDGFKCSGFSIPFWLPIPNERPW